MLIFFDPHDTDAYSRNAEQGPEYGLLMVTHESYPNTIVEPKTGFAVNAGENIILHVHEDFDGRRLPRRNWFPGLAYSLGEVAFYLNNLPEGNEPQHVLGVTHAPMARLACSFGFRHFVPDQSFISPDYMDRLEESRGKIGEKGIKMGLDTDAHVVFIPTTDLKRVFGQYPIPTRAEMAELRTQARAESAQLKRLAAE